MGNKKLFLVSLAILTIFMFGAVSATDDISVDNLTVEESSLDSIEEESCDVDVDDEGSQATGPILNANQQEDIVADKKPISMNLSIVGRGEGPIFSVNESGFEVEIEADYYVKVSLSDKVNGTYSLYIDNKFISNKNVTSKTHYLALEDISRGKHVVKVEYSGNDEYQPVSSELAYKVISHKCEIWYDSLRYGQTFYSVGVLGHNPTGDIVAIIDGKRYTAPLIRGEAFFEVPVLSEGSHKIHVDYSGDDNHDPILEDGEFDIYYEILYNGYFIGFNQDNVVSLRLPNDAKGNLLVNVDGETVGNVTLVNGYASVSLDNFKEIGKKYVLYAEYTGSDYEVDFLDDCVFINVPDVQVEHEMIENQEYVFTFELPNSYFGNLSLDIPGYDNKISSEVTNGKASIRFVAKETGTINGYYKDDSGYVHDFEEYIFVGPNPNMVVTVETKAGQNQVFKVNVPNDAGGAISVIINGKEYTSSYFTKSGSLEIPGLADGKYTATVIYSGDYKYPSVSKTITFTKTSKKTTKISLKLTKVKVKKSAKKLVLKATLKINGKLAKGKKITFKFNKKTYKAKTNKKGVAKVTIKKSVLKKLKVGKKVKYQASYGKTTVKKTVKVKK